jgi:hypothetical protein
MVYFSLISEYSHRYELLIVNKYGGHNQSILQNVDNLR